MTNKLNIHFIRIFLPSFILVSTLIFVAYKVESGSSGKVLLNDQKNITYLTSETVTDFFKYASEDLLFLASQGELKDNLSIYNKEAFEEVANEYIAFCEIKPFCEQVRIIDKEGMEILNIRRKGEGAVKVPDEELQEKSHRYYFKETLKLDRDEIYISPMDLNIENGRVEVPWKPVIRLATPVFDESGEKQGIVVMNLLTTKLLEKIAIFSKRKELKQMIINPEGYWLYGGGMEYDYAFTFEDRKDRSFGNINPEAWRQISTQSMGQVVINRKSGRNELSIGEGIYTFLTLYHSGKDYKHSEFDTGEQNSGTDGGISAENTYWKIISYLPARLVTGTTVSWYLAIYAIAICFLIVLCDFIARHRVCKSEGEERYQKLHESAFDGIVVTDKDGIIVENNNSIEKIFGYFSGELIGKNILQLIPEQFRKEQMDGFERYIKSGVSWLQGQLVQVEGLRKTGDVFPMELIISSFNAAGSYYTTGTIRDISKRKRIENDLLLEKERLSLMLSSIGDGVIATDTSGKVTIINRVAEELTGWSEEDACGKPFVEVFNIINVKTRESCEDPLREVMEGNADTCGLEQDAALLSRNGSERFLSASIAPVKDKRNKFLGAIIVFRDLTRRMTADREKAALEQQLLHAQKLEAIGTLAAGIAHEINTPIQFIGDNTRFFKESVGDLMTVIEKYRKLRDSVNVNEKTEKLLNDIEEAEATAEIEYLAEDLPAAITEVLEGVGRVSTIVKAMKSFSHPDSEDMALSDINKAIGNTLIISRNEYKYVAEIMTDFDEELPMILCFLNELNQVFLNLIVNAAHAIEDGNKETGEAEPGLITIVTRVEKDNAVIEISDNGTGIPEKARGRIFEPFYTTKEVGRGTGQGLAMAHSVITKKHHGTIAFTTWAGRGTTFNITLPLVQGERRKRA